MRTVACACVVALACGLPSPARAADRWETGLFADDDFRATTRNELRHGSVQFAHDLEGLADQDWMIVRVQASHSYEARVLSGTVAWTDGAIVNLPVFDRVDSSGNVLTAGVFDGPVNPGASFRSSRSVHWIAGADGTEFLRVVGDTNNNLGAQNQYDVEFYDTTYFAPRFNNSATQVTVLIVQNTKTALVAGDIRFYSAAGALLHTQAMSLSAQGALVLNSATIPALQGQSGSISIAHTGGYGALAGKAVAVEAATGFAFDTALSPLPR